MGQQTYHGKILDGVDYPWDLFIWSQWKWGHSNCWNSLQAIFVWVIAVKWMHWKVATLHFLKTMELNHMQMNSLFLKELKLSVSQKKIEESKHLLKDFSDYWDPLLNDLEDLPKNDVIVFCWLSFCTGSKSWLLRSEVNLDRYFLVRTHSWIICTMQRMKSYCFMKSYKFSTMSH